MPPTKDDFRKAIGHFATGVTVITVAGGPLGVHGMTANAVSSVSLEPLLLLICVDARARLLPLLHASERFGVNILREDQRTFSDYFAQPGDDAGAVRTLGIEFRTTPRGTPLLAECLAQFDCAVHAAHLAGDHTIFIGGVEEVALFSGRPLLYFGGGYRALGGDL